MKLVRAKVGYRKVGDKWSLAKRCTCCGRWLVVSEANFRKQKAGKYGLTSQCRGCKKKKDKQYYQANRGQNKQYYQNNKEKIIERQKRYYQDNREKKIEYGKQYYQTNREKIVKKKKQYRQSPQGQIAMFNEGQRRRIKEEQQGDGITKDQWLEMMSFFNWRCAYSGEVLTKDNRSVDHIVPLNSNGDNMIWNMVPMLRSLNCSKHANNMEEWYREQDCYSEARLEKIYKWQEYAYNKYGKDTEYFNTNSIQIKLL